MSDEGDSIWAWQVQEPNGKWSMVGTMVGGMHHPLMHRSKALIERMSIPAMEHAVRTRQPLRLARFDLAETSREYRPDD